MSIDLIQFLHIREKIPPSRLQCSLNLYLRCIVTNFAFINKHDTDFYSQRAHHRIRIDEKFPRAKRRREIRGMTLFMLKLR
jgi:hypothetical protein